MASITYHHHTIITTPVSDDNTGKWKSSTCVSWPNKENARRVRFLPISPELFLRFEDAEHVGLEAGKSWVETGFKKALAG